MPEHIKQKRCKVCKEHYTPHRTTQQVCSATCAYKHAEKLRVKKEKQQAIEHRRKVRQARQASKRLPELVKEAQVAFNTFIRYRDKDKTCISCGRSYSAGGLGGGYDAGHYRSTGAAPHMRFNEDNCFGQCKHCNNYLSGNVVEMRKGIIKRIGLERVEAVENSNDSKKVGRDELIEIKERYRLKLKELKQSEV